MKIVFSGDILIADSVTDVGFGVLEKARKNGSLAFLEPVSRAFERADLSIGNLEFAISDRTPRSGIDAQQHLAPLSFLLGIAGLGLNVFNVANNHVMQHGEKAFRDTLSALNDINAGVIGSAVKPYIVVDRHGFKVGVIGASTKFDPFMKNPLDYYLNIYPDYILKPLAYRRVLGRLNKEDAAFFQQVYRKNGNDYLLDIRQVRRALKSEVRLHEIITDAQCDGFLLNPLFDHVKELRNKCGFLIVYMHWGDEYVHVPAAWQVRMGRKLVDLGARLVVGCHSHTVQGIENYKNGLIAYSLGNFFFHSNNPANMESFLLEVDIKPSGRGKAGYRHEKVPYMFDRATMRPELMAGKAAKEFKARVVHYSARVGRQSRHEYLAEVFLGLKTARKYKKIFFAPEHASSRC